MSRPSPGEGRSDDGDRRAGVTAGAGRKGIRLVDLPGRVGEVMVGTEAVVRMPSGAATRLTVENTSAWPVVITSHFHFFEANRWLRFDRAAAFGRHLDVDAGGSVRFEPGETKEVDLVPYGGDRAVYGFNGLTNAVLGAGDEDTLRSQALARLRTAGYLDTGETTQTPHRADEHPGGRA
jgi:urease beta subunit